MKLAVRIDYWTDFVGTFDPRKVVGLLKRAFPEAVIDPTDYEAARLDRALEHFAKIPEPRSSAIMRLVRRDAQDNGPTFRFEIPTDAGPIKGQARRYRVTLDLPERVSDGLRGRLEAFLKDLRLGEPKWDA